MKKLYNFGKVNCGKKRAVSCYDCPCASYGGNWGEGWCKGDCQWLDNECQPKKPGEKSILLETVYLVKLKTLDIRGPIIGMLISGPSDYGGSCPSATFYKGFFKGGKKQETCCCDSETDCCFDNCKRENPPPKCLNDLPFIPEWRLVDNQYRVVKKGEDEQKIVKCPGKGKQRLCIEGASLRTFITS